MDELVERGLKNKRESKYIEFKESIDLGSTRDWCEIIKDIVAIANTGGGVVVFGVNNTGEPVGADVSNVLDLDPAQIADKIYKYTGIHFSDFEVLERDKSGKTVAILRIQSVTSPIVFEKPGTYPIENGKQKTAFAQGSVYFRHGAKSETGNSEDIRRMFERNLELIREEWMKGVSKVIHAPPGHHIAVLPQEVVQSDSPEATPIRITDDPAAPAYYRVDKDDSHPCRQKELIDEINKRLPEDVNINTYDTLAVRRVHDLDGNRVFCHQPKYSSLQYSNDFIEWILKQYREDNSFFEKARRDFYEMKNDV